MANTFKNAYLDKLTDSKITNDNYNLVNGAYIKAAESLSTEELILLDIIYSINSGDLSITSKLFVSPLLSSLCLMLS